MNRHWRLTLNSHEIGGDERSSGISRDLAQGDGINSRVRWPESFRPNTVKLEGRRTRTAPLPGPFALRPRPPVFCGQASGALGGPFDRVLGAVLAIRSRLDSVREDRSTFSKNGDRPLEGDIATSFWARGLLQLCRGFGAKRICGVDAVSGTGSRRWRRHNHSSDGRQIEGRQGIAPAGRRRHARRNGPVKGSASPSDPGRSARQIRHGDRRRRHHR